MVAALGRSESEADYVKNLWASGVLTVPRYAEGTTEVIVGYKVALRPARDQQQPLWHAAGKVHKSLTLTNVRARFTDDPSAATEAAAMWRRVDPRVGATPPGRQHRDGAAGRAARHLAEVNRIAAQLGPDELTEWAALARDTAGVWAQAATELEPDGRGPVSRAAEAVWRDGTTLDATIAIPPRSPHHQGIARAIRLLTQSSRNDILGWLAVLEQLARTNAAIAAARAARSDLDNAHYLLTRTQEAVTHQQLHATTVATTTAIPTVQRGDPAIPSQRDRPPEPER